MKCEKVISTYHLWYNRKTQYLVRSTFFFSLLSLSLNIARRTAREQRLIDVSIVLIFKKNMADEDDCEQDSNVLWEM